LLGNTYEVLIDIEPEDITINDFKLSIENVDFENLQPSELAVEQNINLGSNNANEDSSLRENTIMMQSMSASNKRDVFVTR
jgi:hypothetical protein